MQRLAVLFSRLSGYMAACLEALHEEHGVELLVVRVPPAGNAPFDERHFDWIDRLYDRDALTVGGMKDIVDDFGPDAVFMSGWFDDGYLQVAREVRERGVLVVAGSDAQWTGSWRQQGARLLAPWYLHSAIDVLWVAGERQRQLARRLGYRGRRCWEGVYACDWGRFAAHYETETGPSRRFLYVGRYVPEKGVDLLADAYAAYRNRVADPWPLVCAGSGVLEDRLDAQAGIENEGFVQPDALPRLMAQGGAFVLPSRDEPWGVVVQEAAAAGCPLLCSEASGAAVHLLNDGYNGYRVQSESVDHLTECLVRMSALSEETRAQMGARSHALSRQYTPTRWAETLTTGVRHWHDGERSH